MNLRSTTHKRRWWWLWGNWPGDERLCLTILLLMKMRQSLSLCEGCC